MARKLRNSRLNERTRPVNAADASSRAVAELDHSRALNARLTRALERLAFLDPARNAFDDIAETVRVGLDCRWVNVGRRLPGSDVIELVGVAGDGPAENGLRYTLAGTSCERSWTLADPVVVVAQNVGTRFPGGSALEIAGVQSYRGAGLLAPDGELLGLLVTIDDRCCRDDPAERALLRTAAARATQELQRIAAERLRVEQEQRLAAALAISNLGILEWHVRDDRLEVNARFAEILGWSPEAIGHNRAAWVAMVHPEDFPRVAKLLDDLLRAGSAPAACEYRLRARSGGWHWVRVQAHVIERDDHGRALRLLGVYADIHEQRLAEQALRDKEAHLTLAIESAGLAEILWDIETDNFAVNPVWPRLLGYRDDEIPPTGAAWVALTHPDDYDYASRRIGEFLRKGTFGTPLTYRIRAKDGSWRHVQMGGNVIDRNAAGRATRAHGLFMDVQATHEAAEMLRASKARLRAVLDNSPIGIYLNSPDGQLVYANRVYLETVGLNEAQASGYAWEVYVHPEDRAATVKRWRDFCASPDGEFDLDFRALDTDRGELMMRTRATSIRENGELLGFTGTIEDITARRAEEAARQRLHTQIQQAQKMEAIGQLTGGIAHDFNNILASVLGFTRLARRLASDHGNAKLDDYLAAVEQGGERARELVAKMLAFSRHTPGQEQHRVSARLLIDEAVQFLQPMVPAGIHIAKDVDPSAGDVMVEGVDLHQALVNLAVNARDAIGEYGRISIRLRGAKRWQARCASCNADFSGEFIEVALTDDGCGIAPEHVARLFEPFFSTKDVGKGTGMGLAVTHGMLHRAQGHIVVETALALGTTVTLLLRPAPPEAVAGTRPAAAAAARRAAGGRILLVDDEAPITRMLGALLESHGYQVVSFNDAQAALDWSIVHDHGFDALITDQTMPGMSGLELARRVLAHRPDLPILLCTGYSDVVDEAVCSNAGIRHFMRKPVPFEQLLEALASSLAGTARRPR